MGHPMTAADALSRSESHLELLTRGDEAATLGRWRCRCPELGPAPISTPCEIVGWLRDQPAMVTDAVLRFLTYEAQMGDQVALLVLVGCLSPGIRALANRTGITIDEAVSELVVGILEYPVARRSSIAGGLLLDARNRIHRHHQRNRRLQPIDQHPHVVHVADERDPTPPAQRIVQLVCEAHKDGVINQTDAELIIHTRVGGHQVRPIARRLGISPSAAYQRRHRAEARLAHAAR
jgi:hypothetical protein